MLSPQELIGQKVWLSLQSDAPLSNEDLPRVKAEIVQPTSPPWFFARYIDPPRTVHASGQWLTLYEAQQAVLIDPVIEYEDDCVYDELYEDEFNYS